MSERPSRLDCELRNDVDWEAQDALAEHFQAEKRAGLKMAKLSSPCYRNALNALKILAKGLSLGERRALLCKIFDDLGAL